MNKSSGSFRWFVAIMGTVLQLCLGTVYAWSYFQKPLMAQTGWNNSTVAWAFSFAICFLGLAAAWGGINLPKMGPQKLAMAGGIFYGSGYLIASWALAHHNLVLLYLGFGVIGGIGLGLGYVTPVATAAKWFPDKKGFITGMVIMGFGLGALLISKVIAPVLMTQTAENLPMVFRIIGLIMLVLCTTAGFFLRNPPEGFVPAGWTPPAATSASAVAASAITAKSCIMSKRFLLMWIIFFFNITAGIMFIGFQSPMLQKLLKTAGSTLDIKGLAAAGATLIAISSIFNGIGRFFWGGLSDKVGRIQVFRMILGSQTIVFAALPFVSSPIIFGVLVCYILLCYGGSFGSMPSFVSDTFGVKPMAVVYGTILTAWSAGGIVGPQLVAIINDRFAERASVLTFGIGAALLACGFLISFALDNKHFELKKA